MAEVNDLKTISRNWKLDWTLRMDAKTYKGKLIKISRMIHLEGTPTATRKDIEGYWHQEEKQSRKNSLLLRRIAINR